MSHAVAMVGLGNAGAVLAHALSEKFPLSGYDVDPKRKVAVENLSIAWSSSIESVVADADVVLLSLPRPEISIDVVGTIVRARTAARLVIETSTITPKTARELAATCSTANIGFVDAAIAGGVQSIQSTR